MDLEVLTGQLRHLCIGTGDLIQQERQKMGPLDIEMKGTHNLVTSIDRMSEERLVGELLKLLPEAGFIVEEGTVTKVGKEYHWIIDPIDGTTNFVHGIPVYSISVALQHRDEIIAGAVYEINRRECFYSWKGGRAFLNDQAIHVSGTTSLDDSLLATGFPYNAEGKTGRYLDIFHHLLLNSRGIRRLGSAAVDLAYLACGRFDGFYEYGLNPWDVAAGAFIVRQAGGKVTDFHGGDDYLHGRTIIASNAYLHEKIKDVIDAYFVTGNP